TRVAPQAQQRFAAHLLCSYRNSRNPNTGKNDLARPKSHRAMKFNLVEEVISLDFDGLRARLPHVVVMGFASSERNFLILEIVAIIC
ncbi:MAG TPA: hypothetical protein VGZ22_14080, partial [Isosphaeraceae bacterium]|nr:hypothetical protein [Isosphaeraceae bacterium]